MNQDPASPGRLLAVADAILDDNPYGFLVSHGSGTSVRLVHHLARDPDAVLWIGTSPRSRKVADARRTAGFSYAVEDRSRFAYVALIGEMAMVDDPAALSDRWVPTLAAFFPDGPLGGDFVLLRLAPRRIELMSFADAVHPSPFGLVPAVIERSSPSSSWEQVPAARFDLP